MTNEIMIFEGNNVEVIEVEGKVLFNAKNVAEVLDIKNIRENLRNMSDKQVILLKNSNVKNSDFRKLANRGENFLTEAGVYKLAFRSNKESAERFTNWVTEEVLPTIRKHGAYMTEQTIERALTDPDFLIQLATQLKDEKEKNKKLVAENKEMLPKVTYYDEILASKDSLLITQIAQDYGLSGRKLNTILNELKVQYKKNNQWILYSKYKDKGYIKSETLSLENGKTVVHTRWTQKGRVFLYEILKDNGYLPLKEMK